MTAARPPGRVRARLAELGLTLHGPHPPHDPLDAVVVHGGVARTSGQLPRIDGELTCIGTLGLTVTVEEGAAPPPCAPSTPWPCWRPSWAPSTGWSGCSRSPVVASAPDFHQQPAVVDGASAILFDVFGEAGRHTRRPSGWPPCPGEVRWRSS